MLAITDKSEIRMAFYKFMSQLLSDYLVIDILKCFLVMLSITHKS